MGFQGGNYIQNYYMKDHKAYTEDNVLVYNIFIYKVPRNVSQEEVLDYFSKFGDILKVMLGAVPKRSRKPKVGFVHFADPLSAAKALQDQCHKLRDKIIGVKACDSWRQPEEEGKKNTSNISDTAAESKEPKANTEANEEVDATAEINMLSLNDDCLEHICRMLELRDQVRFARVCTRFSSVFQMCCKTEHKIVRIDKLNGMTLWETREFLRLAGPSVEVLIGPFPYKDRERIMEFLRKFCRNVKSVDFDSSKLKPTCLRKLLSKMKAVRELQLCDCSLTDNALTIMKKLPNLEILAVPENCELTGKYIDKMTKVKELNLHGCCNIQPTYFIDICKSLKDLKSLDIQRCERFTSGVFSDMVPLCTKLEELKMSGNNVHYESVARLPSLKKLEIVSNSTVRKELFTELAEHQGNQLECLKFVSRNCINYERASLIAELSKLRQLICAHNEDLGDDCLHKFGKLKNLEELFISDCPKITNAGLLSLLRKCTKLRRVNIQRCPLITDSFVFKAIDVLKQRPEELRREQVVFYVLKSGINEFVLNDSKYLDSLSLLKLSFHVPLAMLVDDDMEFFDYLEEYEDDDDFDDIEDDDNDVEFVFNLDREGNFDEPFNIYNFYDSDDLDDDDLHHAYNFFGRYAPYGDDVNDFIW